MHNLKNQYQPYFKGVDPTKYQKYVLWGLRSSQRDTFRHIMRHYYETFRDIGLHVEWVDDTPENAGVIEPGTLVIAPNMAGQHLPIVKGAYYCLHNFDYGIDRPYHQEIPATHNIRLQVYTDDAKQSDQQWNVVTYFDTKTRTLYQPWGTNLLPDQFMEPVFSRLPIVFWVGSIWNDEGNQGNLNEIAELKRVLRKHWILFKNLINVSDETNVKMVRLSRIAPAIGGGIQVRTNLCPCRMFKNISYGQLGISNIAKFNEILGDAAVYGGSTEATVAKALRLKSDEYKSLIRRQQTIIAQDHTYVSKIAKILRAFDEIQKPTPKSKKAKSAAA
jgi:hypothetical protein